ncbi:MAG: hypothetical protein AABZ30_04810 [Myxococcota bacterium]
MSKRRSVHAGDEPLAEYDFRGGVRGKYAGRFAPDANVVVLAPDVAEVFSDSASVNEALRALVRIAAHKRKAGQEPRPARTELPRT